MIIINNYPGARHLGDSIGIRKGVIVLPQTPACHGRPVLPVEIN